MRSQYVFLIKETVITPQSLEQSDCGDILREMLKQGFYLSRIHIFANNSKDALEKFLVVTKNHEHELTARTIICGS